MESLKEAGATRVGSKIRTRRDRRFLSRRCSVAMEERRGYSTPSHWAGVFRSGQAGRRDRDGGVGTTRRGAASPDIPTRMQEDPNSTTTGGTVE
jgi:hypothetical protein